MLKPPKIVTEMRETLQMTKICYKISTNRNMISIIEKCFFFVFRVVEDFLFASIQMVENQLEKKNTLHPLENYSSNILKGYSLK